MGLGKIWSEWESNCNLVYSDNFCFEFDSVRLIQCNLFSFSYVLAPSVTFNQEMKCIKSKASKVLELEQSMPTKEAKQIKKKE